MTQDDKDKDQGKDKDKGQDPRYDSGYKIRFSNPEEFLHFLRKYAKAEWAAGLCPEDITLCDKEFVLEDYRKRTADLVYKIRIGSRHIYAYLIMELQSAADYTMPFRLLMYIFSLMLKIFLAEDKAVRERKGYRLPVVVPILFYNGNGPWNVPLDFRDYQEGAGIFGNHVLDFTYYLIDLKKLSNDYILNTNTLIDNILALDKNRKDREGLGQILEKVEARIRELKEEERVSFFQWLEYVMLAVVDGESKEQVLELMEELKGDGVSMIHGLQLLILNEKEEGIRAGRSEGLKTGRSEGLKVGRSEGLKVGRSEGLKVGRSEGLKVGRSEELLSLVDKKQKKGFTPEEIADILEEDPAYIKMLCDKIKESTPEHDLAKLAQQLTQTAE